MLQEEDHACASCVPIPRGGARNFGWIMDRPSRLGAEIFFLFSSVENPLEKSDV